MDEAARAPLSAWESFYVIVGSAGAALTGLQFVVMALISERQSRSTSNQIDAFGTPTIVHFCAVLLVAAVVSAPWQLLSSVSWLLGVSGAAGIVYGVIVVKRARRQHGYRPVFEDWLWHAVLPLFAYTMILISALMLRRYPERTLFVVGIATLLLLFVGIHNAWDTVTYIVIGGLDQTKKVRDDVPLNQKAKD